MMMKMTAPKKGAHPPESAQLPRKEKADKEARIQEQEARRREHMVAQLIRDRALDEHTARLCSREASWDLPVHVPVARAMDLNLSMPPVPESPASGRSLSTSNFKAA